MNSSAGPPEDRFDELLREIADPQTEDDRRFQAYDVLKQEPSVSRRADAALATCFSDQALTWRDGDQCHALIHALQAYALHPDAKNELLARRLLAYTERLVYHVPHGGGALPLAISPTGAFAALRASFESSAITLRDTATGKAISRVPFEATVSFMAFDGAEKLFAMAFDDKTLTFHDIDTGKRRGAKITLGQAAGWIAFGAESKSIVTLSDSGMLSVLDIESGRPLRQHDLAPLVPGIRSTRIAVLSPDRSLLALHHQGKVVLWDLWKWEPVAEGYSHPETVRHVVFHPGGDRLAVGSATLLQLIDTVTCKPVADPVEDEAFSCPAFDLTVEYLTVGAGNAVAVIDSESGELRHYTLPHGGEIESISHDPEGAWIVTMSGTYAHLYSRESGRPMGRAYPQKFLDRALIHPRQPLLITCESTGSGSMRGWKLPEVGQADGTFSFEKGWFGRDFLADPQKQVIQTREGQAKVVARDSGKALSAVLPHPGRIWAVAFSNGPLIATIDDDGGVRVWDSVRGELRCGPITSEDAIDLKLSPGGDRLFLIEESGVTTLSVPGGDVLPSGRVEFPFANECHAYSQAAMRLVVASAAGPGVVQVIDLGGDQKEAFECKHRLQEVTLLSVSASGLMLLVGRKGFMESQLEVIDMESGASWLLPEHFRKLSFDHACFTSDESLVVTSSGNVCRWWKPRDNGTLEPVSAVWNLAEQPVMVFPDPVAKNDRVICCGTYPGHRHSWGCHSPLVPDDGLPSLHESDGMRLLETHEQRLEFTLRDANGDFLPGGWRSPLEE